MEGLFGRMKIEFFPTRLPVAVFRNVNFYNYVFMRDGDPRGSVCGIELRTSHAEDLGVVPMTMNF